MTNIDNFCARMLTLDKGIRFVGVANKEAKMIGSAYREGLRPLLNPSETEMSILQSIIRMGTRETLEKKLGETVYAFAMYKKVKRVAVPLRRSSKITHILMASFDINVDHEPIILTKILPELEQLAM
ncbi:hypothetical protein [Nitrososphaera sp.]|uniref:hypothetical protein n=1 Tax=Nitrososphaera sp. TaxID=1971748 RepID=UPI002ED80E0B